MRHWRQVLGPLPLFAVLGLLLHPKGAPHAARNVDARAALATALAERGLDATPDSIGFVDPAPSALTSRWRRPRAIVRASQRGTLADVYLVETRMSPEGALLGVADVHNLTKTTAASEQQLVVGGQHAAWVIGSESKTYRVELIDLRGEIRPKAEKWSTVVRLQHAVTSYQRTGQARGIGRRSFKLDPPASRVSLGTGQDALTIEADDHRIVVPFDRTRPVEGERFATEEDREIAWPGNLVTWSVDRARDLSWFGDERMQLTKAVAYRLLDAVDRAVGTVRPARAETEGLRGSSLPKIATDPATGWPPAPIPPLVSPPFVNEGAWLALDHDPFVRSNPDAPAPMITTYLRGDGARPDCLVYVVEWDPRQVTLDMVPGTEEPQSATGETGTGVIPRKPEVMSRLIAAFNGAFQSTHGDYGMMVNGSVLVPPKPYAATVARLQDGSTVFGTWPEDLAIPKDVVAFRQNLTPLVADDRWNPYGREWWGGVPHDWEDETHTVRSALCLTKDDFVAYFYGTKIDPVHLARVMLAARCSYGIHLDMNQGHTGLELYRAFPAGELPSLGKLDGHWQAEGEIAGMPGWQFRGRRLLRNMQLMHFPRYIRRGLRDYFVLLLNPILPGAPLNAGAADGAEGAWNLRDLPQHGFPPAIATTSLRPDPARPETKVRVLKLDPGVLEAHEGTPSGSADPVVLTVDPPSAIAAGAITLWLSPGRAQIADARPAEGARAVWVGTRAPGPGVRAAACIDEGGKILYAEVATAPHPDGDGPLLERVLGTAQCRDRMFLGHRQPLSIGGTVDLSEHPVRPADAAVRLLRKPRRASLRFFPDTPILPPGTWTPLQRQTRFWPKETDAGAAASSRPE